MKSVYLAGPISGLTFAGCTDWRRWAANELLDAGIKPLSPLRGKEYLDGIGELSPVCAGYAHLGALSTPKGIMTRDRFDATRCDVLLVNLLGAARVSIGTVMEIAWADAKRTPIVCAIEEGNLHHHGMLHEACGFMVPTLAEALHLTKAILA
jgi:nucleoside 2-deoxyribosyltransferase